MKYSVSVVKRITLLIMTLALAVAMVACTGATSVKGETGAEGPTGETGPQGPPGTLDNAPPMAVADKPIGNAYLALAGSGAMPSKTVDPSGHFSDAEKAVLTFEAATSDAAVATVTVNAAGMVVVTGKGAGSATVTVSAYDGVNADPATASFDVMVVASNIAPVITPATGGAITDGTEPTLFGAAYTEADLTDAVVAATPAPEALRTLLYMADGTRKVTLDGTFNIIPGAASDFADDLVFEVAMGAAGSADDVVSVDIAKDAATNQWNIVLTPLKAGRQNVVITAKDKFGATHTYDSDTDVDGDDMTPVTLKFIAWVNSPPSLIAGMPMPDKLLVATGTDNTNTFTYYYEQYFDIDEIDKGTPSLTTTEAPATFSGAACSFDPAVRAGLTAIAGRGVTVDPDDTGVTEGSFILTITCTDRDATVSDTATVTLRT